MRYGNPMKRERVVATLKGHTIHFPGRILLVNGKVPKEAKAPEGGKIDPEDGVVYVYVPPLVRHEVGQAGMQPEEELPEEEQRKGAVKPEDQDALKAASFDAFDVLVAAAERDTFGANGAPKGQAMEKLMGYPLTNSELKDLWARYAIERNTGDAAP